MNESMSPDLFGNGKARPTGDVIASVCDNIRVTLNAGLVALILNTHVEVEPVIARVKIHIRQFQSLVKALEKLKKDL